MGKGGFLESLDARRRRAAEGAAGALDLQCPTHGKKQFWRAQDPPELPLHALWKGP